MRKLQLLQAFQRKLGHYGPQSDEEEITTGDVVELATPSLQKKENMGRIGTRIGIHGN